LAARREADVQTALSRLGRTKGIVFWDIGAHFGIHSIGVAMQCGPTGRVVAFEPDPVAFKRLLRHVKLNALGNVKIYQRAASDRTGRSVLFTPGGQGSSNSHLLYYADNDMTGTPRIEIETVAIDELVDSGEIRAPSLIKVDAQGHGGNALQGAGKTIAQSLPLIAFSNHSDAEIEATRRILDPLGYMPEALHGQSIPWSAVDEALLVPPRFRSPS